MSSTLTLEEIRHIALLAKLEFDDASLQKFANEFNSILGYVSKIKECDTEGIEFQHNLSDYKDEVLQEDVPRASLSQEKVLMNATDGRTKFGKYIKTSKIVSKEE